MIRRIAGSVLLPIAVLLGLPLVLYAPFLVPNGRVFYWGVYLLQFYPWRQMAIDQIRAGHWPLWNPTLGAGTPLAANLQTAAFYPPNVLFLLMPAERAFGWSLALHVALAGLGAYALARLLGLRRLSALVAGLAYGAGGYITAHWVFPSMVYAAVWLPLMLALTTRLMREQAQYAANTSPGTQRATPGMGRILCRVARPRMRLAALLALVIALQLLAGHAQTSFYSLLIVAAWALVSNKRPATGTRPAAGIVQQAARLTHGILLALVQAVSRFASYLWRLVPVALAVVWGLALAAIQLLPTAELAAHSQRAGRLADLRFAFELSFWPWRLITLAAPDFFGNPLHGEYWAYGTYWEEASFVGVLALLLAGRAVAWWWRARRLPAEKMAGSSQPGQPGEKESRARAAVPFFALLAVISLLLALGNHTPIYPFLFRYVPGFGLFQAPARLMIGYALGIAMLAGSGAQQLSGRRLNARQRRTWRLVLLAGLGIGLAGLGAWLALPAIPASFGSSAVRFGLTLALAAGLFLARHPVAEQSGLARHPVAERSGLARHPVAERSGLAQPGGPDTAGSPAQRSRLRAGGRTAQVLAVALVAADLLVFGWRLAPAGSTAIYHQPVASADFLKNQAAGRLVVVPSYAESIYDRYVSLRSYGPPNAAELQGLRESLVPNLNSVHDLAGLGNYDPLTVGRWRDVWDSQLASDLPDDSEPRLDLARAQRVWDLAGVRYIVAGDEALPLPQLYAGPPAIYRNDTALPEALVVPTARVISDEQASLAAVLDPQFDPYAEVVLSREPAGGSASASSPQTAAAPAVQPQPAVLRQGPDRVIIEVTMVRPGYLVLTDTFYPGWQATADGHSVDILPANHAFRAVYLDAGEHTVVFEYEPLSFRVGAWISGGAILLLLVTLGAAALVTWLSRGRPPAAEPPGGPQEGPPSSSQGTRPLGVRGLGGVEPPATQPAGNATGGTQS